MLGSSSIFGQLGKSIKPLALSSFGLFSSSSISRHSSTSAVKRYLVREASPMAPREVPTPLVMLSTAQWDSSTKADQWTDWSSMLSSKGFTCIEIDIAPPPEEDRATYDTSEKVLDYMSDVLAQQIKLSAHIFPPVLLARSASCLVAQTYISSHPCSALFLLDPPPSPSSIPTSTSSGPGSLFLPTPLKDFDYEPRFPIGVMVNGDRGEQAFKNSRLGRDAGGRVECLRVDGDIDGSSSNRARNDLERWMDRAGI